MTKNKKQSSTKVSLLSVKSVTHFKKDRDADVLKTNSKCCFYFNSSTSGTPLAFFRSFDETQWRSLDLVPALLPLPQFASTGSPLRLHAPTTRVIRILIRACNSWKKYDPLHVNSRTVKVYSLSAFYSSEPFHTKEKNPTAFIFAVRLKTRVCCIIIRFVAYSQKAFMLKTP